MHVNHRRKNKPPVNKWATQGRLGLYSYKLMRQAFWRCRRARDRVLMDHGLYDLLPERHPASILWDYW